MPNGSFEEYSQCPEEREYFGNGQFSRCKGWFYSTHYSIGTPDYYNICNNSIGGPNQGVVGIPSNERGFQSPYSGNGMIGFSPISLFASTQEYDGQESISCKLLTPLIGCNEYHFQCYVNLSDVSTYSISNLGIVFSKDSMHLNNFQDIHNVIPNIEWETPITDTTGWTKLSGNFIALGAESFFTFGYFKAKEETIWIPNDTNSIFSDFDFAYIFVDSLSITSLGKVENCSVELPNVLTPNGDMINDSYSIIDLGISSMTIINRWGNVIAILDEYNPIWDGTSGGIPCSEGTYFYKAIYKEEEITGFIELIR